MKISYLIFSALLALSFQRAHSSEADGFTKRNEPLADSSEVINHKANQYVQNSLLALNANNSGCVEGDLYKELRVYFANHLSGKLVKEIFNGNDIPKRVVPLDESVYKDWTPWDGLGMGLKFTKKSGMTIAPIIHFGNEIIGADKFEHFFGQGFYYFTQNYLKEKGYIKAIKTGIMKEKIFLGGNKLGNGVFSYGDLSANFNGMRFWNHILQKHDDILGADRNLGPYISCESNKWVQVKEIDFRDYMDSAMDESINCSKFPTQHTADRFTREVHKLGMACPIDPHKLDELVAKYGALSKWVINKDGTGVIKYFGEYKNKK